MLAAAEAAAAAAEASSKGGGGKKDAKGKGAKGKGGEGKGGEADEDAPEPPDPGRLVLYRGVGAYVQLITLRAP